MNKIFDMKRKIRALLLAAGLGTRLRPLTFDIPKCLVKVSDKTMLEEWIDKLVSLGTEKIIINTHYKAEKVESFLKTQKNKTKIYQFNEVNLLGTAGTLIANKEIFKNSTGLLIHVDNYTEIKLKDLLKAHLNRPKNCLLTMLTFKTNDPQNCGIVKPIMKEF